MLQCREAVVLATSGGQWGEGGPGFINRDTAIGKLDGMRGGIEKVASRWVQRTWRRKVILRGVSGRS